MFVRSEADSERVGWTTDRCRARRGLSGVSSIAMQPWERLIVEDDEETRCSRGNPVPRLPAQDPDRLLLQLLHARLQSRLDRRTPQLPVLLALGLVRLVTDEGKEGDRCIEALLDASRGGGGVKSGGDGSEYVGKAREDEREEGGRGGSGREMRNDVPDEVEQCRSVDGGDCEGQLRQQVYMRDERERTHHPVQQHSPSPRPHPQHPPSCPTGRPAPCCTRPGGRAGVRRCRAEAGRIASRAGRCGKGARVRLPGSRLRG